MMHTVQQVSDALTTTGLTREHITIATYRQGELKSKEQLKVAAIKEGTIALGSSRKRGLREQNDGPSILVSRGSVYIRLVSGCITDFTRHGQEQTIIGSGQINIGLGDTCLLRYGVNTYDISLKAVAISKPPKQRSPLKHVQSLLQVATFMVLGAFAYQTNLLDPSTYQQTPEVAETAPPEGVLAKVQHSVTASYRFFAGAFSQKGEPLAPQMRLTPTGIADRTMPANNGDANQELSLLEADSSPGAEIDVLSLPEEEASIDENTAELMPRVVKKAARAKVIKTDKVKVRKKAKMAVRKRNPRPANPQTILRRSLTRPVTANSAAQWLRSPGQYRASVASNVGSKQPVVNKSVSTQPVTIKNRQPTGASGASDSANSLTVPARLGQPSLNQGPFQESRDLNVQPAG